jgi:hypothetical protein
MIAGVLTFAAAAAAATTSVQHQLTVDCSGQTASAFSSLLEARDALRALRRRSRLTRTQHRDATAEHPRAIITVRGTCAAGLHLEGPQDGNVEYVGELGAAISGGLPLDPAAFTAVTEPTALAGLPASAKRQVKQLNLTALGLTADRIGELGPHVYPGGNAQIDFYKFEPVGASELWWGKRRPLHRARFPNVQDDQLLIPQNSMVIGHVERTPLERQGGGALEVMTTSSGTSTGRKYTHRELVPTPAQLEAWAAELAAGRKVWAHGEWSALGWADTHKPVVAVNASGGTVTTMWAPPKTSEHNTEGSSSSGGWFRVYNLLRCAAETRECSFA